MASINSLNAHCPKEKRRKKMYSGVRNEFVPYYDIHNADDSRPYPGIPALLSYLQSAGIQIAVASNKYQAATESWLPTTFRKFISLPFSANGRSQCQA